MGGGGSKSKSRAAAPVEAPAKEKAQITSSDRAKLQLKMQRDNLSAAIRKYERVEAVEHDKAKEFLKAGNKRKALYCLKREKAQANQISVVTALLENVQTLVDTLQFQEVEVEVMGALKDGKDELVRLNKLLNIEDVEKLMDETAESIEQAQEIDAVLNQKLGNDIDDDELLDELREQMGESAPSQKVPTPTKTTTDALGDAKIPSHPIGSNVKKPVHKESEEEEESRVMEAA